MLIVIRFGTTLYNHPTDYAEQAAWEGYATEMANAKTDQELVDLYKSLAAKNRIDLNAPAHVVFARDTRASGSRLAACLTDALVASEAKFTDYKILTTPQLHYMVRCINTNGTEEEYGEPTEKGYYEKLSGAFKLAMKNKKPSGALTVDCANGVGGPKLVELIKYLPPKDESLDIKVVNDNVLNPDSLNVEVGKRRAPFRKKRNLMLNLLP